jgi:colicin import membrane protein
MARISKTIGGTFLLLLLSACVTRPVSQSDTATEAVVKQELAPLAPSSEVYDAVTESQRVVTAIRRKIERNWIKPKSGSKGLRCTIQVELAEGGEVTLAKVVRSSGNVKFDRSVLAAVRKASPLPVPVDARLFEQFRSIEFMFSPQGQ